MTYTSTGLTATQKAWLNLLSYICLLIAGGTGYEALAGNLPAWVPSIPVAAGVLSQLIQLFLSGRLDPAIAAALPELQVILAQAKQGIPVATATTTTPITIPSVVIAAPAPAPAATASPLSPGFVNPNAAAPDI
jgi:hypothetical protein